MKQEIFEIILMLIKVGLLVISAFLVPSIKRWIETNTSEKQRLELLYWLSKNKINVTPEQADVVIETIVDYFNRKGWNKDIKEL